MVSMSDIKGLFQLLKKTATLDDQKRIIELETLVNDLRYENLELNEKIAELQAACNVSKELKYEAPYYWRRKPDGSQDGPFCQLCYDLPEKSLIRLQREGRGIWKCLACQSLFEDANYELPPIGRRSIPQF